MTHYELTQICTFHISLNSFDRNLPRELQKKFFHNEIIKLTIKDHKVIAYFDELEDSEINPSQFIPKPITFKGLLEVLDDNIFIKVSTNFINNQDNIIHKIFYDGQNEVFELY